MPKPKFNKRTLQSLKQLTDLRQQLADQEYEALKAAQEAAAARQQTAGEAAARASNILNNAKGVRQASTGRMHFTKSKNGSGVYVPVTSSGKVDTSTASIKAPSLTIKDIQMPAPPITGRIRIKSSTDPFVNVTQSMQNAYDLGLPGLQSMFKTDMSFMHAPLMQRLADKTGRTAQSISKQINPETGQIYTNYFDVVEPHYAQWRKLHEMAGKDRPTSEQVETMFQTPQMKTIFSRMQDLLGINPSLYPTEALETSATTVKNPYIAPETNVVSNHIGPDMGPGLYGYDVSTKGWRPLAEFSVERTLGKPDKYSMFSQIGEPSSIKFDSNDIIESGVNFEGTPFSVIQNKPVEQKTYDFNPFWGWKLNKNFNVLWGKKPPYLKQGGVLFAKSGIHIKKANRGKFTDYCGGKVTSECIARGKASSNPTIRKRATFAANARKWKHQNGGLIYTGFYPNYKQSDLDYWDFNAYNVRFPIEPVSLYRPQSSDSFQTTVNQTSDNIQTPLKKQDTKITTTVEQPYTPAPLIPKGIVEYKSKDIDIGNMKELVELMKDEGISFRITSGSRPGALTSKGLPSHHSTGNALDITPIQGQTWDDLINQMKKSKKFIAYMKEHKLGILDERSPEMQARTGATGAHFHIGPDQKAVSNFNLMFK